MAIPGGQWQLIQTLLLPPSPNLSTLFLFGSFGSFATAMSSRLAKAASGLWPNEAAPSQRVAVRCLHVSC